MKKTLLLIFINFLFTFGQKPEFSELVVPPKQIVRVDYPLFKPFKIKIYNKSKFFLGISLLSSEKDSLYENFNLEKGKFRSLVIRDNQYLQFENRYLASLKVAFTLEKGNQMSNKSPKNLTPQRAFYLENNPQGNGSPSSLLKVFFYKLVEESCWEENHMATKEIQSSQ